MKSLRFIEDRSLLDPSHPKRNPAVNWERLTVAGVRLVGGWVDPRLRGGGGSTLATQLEKFRHYPDGLTRSVDDKFHQMFSAATRSYLDGPETLGAQERVVLDYLNATPLSARSSYGEVIGIPEGLWAWYGTDIETANAALIDDNPANIRKKADAYKQVLSLLLAQRRPSYYLLENRQALLALTDQYLRLLSKAGVIDAKLRDAALRARLTFRTEAPASPPASFLSRKAANSVRTELLRMLGTQNFYDLDRLDLTANTTFDASVQNLVSETLGRLGNRQEAQTLGLLGPRLLGSQDLSRMAYSVVIYEREGDRNVVRVRADSLNQPFNINSGSKLILGSTAKLRTLLTYLDIIRRLHDTYQNMLPADLWAISDKADSRLTRWATAYLAQTNDHNLQAMLDAAVQRRYSASSYEAFFTGGAVHVFDNYESYFDEDDDDDFYPTVEYALVHSINLVFIRVMRDIRDYYIAEAKHVDVQSATASTEINQKYLNRFAEAEGATYLRSFYNDFHGKSVAEMLSITARRSGRTAKRLTVAFRSVLPDAPASELGGFLAKELPNRPLEEDDVAALYEECDPALFSLDDRAYLAALHPLRLWLASYLKDHPKATFAEALTASEDQRQESYRWLLYSRNPRAQNERIKIIQEQDAFERILEDWQKQGYPFQHLVPSLATAIGSSGDRPDALAELMGIILNDGVRMPTVDIERLRFAAGTPYETELAFAPKSPARIFAPEIVHTVRRALMKVVSGGTALRLRGAFLSTAGSPLPVGGKTGTGDNRFKVYGRGHELLESRVVDRTATFVFFLDDRFYGTVTGYVDGPEAANYHFTSALAVQLLKSLASQIRPLVTSGRTANTTQTNSETRHRLRVVSDARQETPALR